MSIHFSPSLLAFYDSDVNPTIPEDAIQISHEVRDDVLALCSMGAMELAASAEGLPIAIARLQPVEVPGSVTMRQARLALLEAGKLTAVEAAIAAMESPQREAAQIEWEYATTVDRGSQFLQGLASALGMDDDELDQLFILAADK